MINKVNEYLDLVKKLWINLHGSASAERLLKDWGENKNIFHTIWESNHYQY